MTYRHPRPIHKAGEYGVFKDYPFPGQYTIKRRKIQRGRVYWAWVIPLDSNGKPVDLTTEAQAITKLKEYTKCKP